MGTPRRHLSRAALIEWWNTVTITYLAQPRRQTLPPAATRAQPLWVAGHAAIITAVGEVDAHNAKSFADQVCAAISDVDRSAHTITVDLTGLAFFAVDGCAALHAVNALVMRLGVVWSVLPSPAVGRVLELCDPAQLIPVSPVDPRLQELAEPA